METDVRHSMFELLRHCCDRLIAVQLRDGSDRHGGFWCPGCRTVHGRCGDAIFPLYYMYGVTGEAKYREAARLLRQYAAATQQPDGSWLNEPFADWKGTTVFQLLSLCHAYDYLSAHGEAEEAQHLREMIAASAAWVSETFGSGGKTNVNYYLTAAICLRRAYEIAVGDGQGHGLGQEQRHGLYAEQAERLMQTVLQTNLTRDGFLLGEKTMQRAHTQITGTADIGYNLDMSLGAMAEYAVLTGNERIKQMTVHALRKHMEMMYPDGSMDNSFGSRNYKWTLFGSKTAHGCQMAFMLLADQDPAFVRAAELSTSYLASRLRAGDGWFGYGPMHDELFAEGCNHPTFNRADALAVALAYGKELAGQAGAESGMATARAGAGAVAGAESVAASAVAGMVREAALGASAGAWSGRSRARIPSETPFGVREYAELGVHHLRSGRWMGTVSCYRVQNAPVGGAMSYLWHEAAGPVQLGGVTEYRRYEPFNMPPAPAGHEETITSRIEAVRLDRKFSNLYEYDAYSASSGDAAAPEVQVRGRLKSDEDGAVYDCGILYAIRYRIKGNRVEKRYELDVRLPCEQVTITEPIVSGTRPELASAVAGVGVGVGSGAVAGAGSEEGVAAGSAASMEEGQGAGWSAGRDAERAADGGLSKVMREDRLSLSLAGGCRLNISGAGDEFILDPLCLGQRAVSLFPSVTAVPLRWQTGPLAPGVYQFHVSLEIID